MSPLETAATPCCACCACSLLKWYNVVLKLLGCLTLFMTANLLKVFFAKMVASKFNQASHYTKMQEALKRVCVVVEGWVCVWGGGMMHSKVGF